MKKLLLFWLVCALSMAATCNKAQKPNDCIGEKNEDMACIEIYKPVCGCDGKTYPNDCYARREGIKKWTEGPCEGD